jgi:hypothetical protein
MRRNSECLQFFCICCNAQSRDLLDAAYASGRREAESLYAKKQRQLNLMLAELHEVSEHLSAGRQWLVDYMQQQQQTKGHASVGTQAGAGTGPSMSVSAKLEAATRSVLYRDLMRRAQQQCDPADEVQPRLDVQDMDEEALTKSLKQLFHITDPEVITFTQ